MFVLVEICVLKYLLCLDLRFVEFIVGELDFFNWFIVVEGYKIFIEDYFFIGVKVLLDEFVLLSII